MSTILSLSLQNRPGALADLLEAMGERGISVYAVEAEAMGDFGMVRLGVSDGDAALALAKEHAVQAVRVEAVDLDLANRPGELARVLRRLAAHGVNVVSLFGSVPQDAASGRLLLRVNDREKALRAMAAKD